MTDLNNAYFRFDDPRVEVVGGMVLHPTWWSRFYEYAFAMQFMEKTDTVADMGCGWMGRPFVIELAAECKEVFGIDADIRVYDLYNNFPNLYYLPMNFCNSDMGHFKTSTFDKIYCISVIEDISPSDRLAALTNFRRLIKPKGKILITMDCVWEPFRISEPYPTVNVNHLIQAVEKAGLRFVGDVDNQMPDNAVHQSEWNLACFHCVLERND